MLLVVNKFDLVDYLEEEYLEEYMQNGYLYEFAEENNFIGFIRVSAMSGENVNFAWSMIVKDVLENDHNKRLKKQEDLEEEK